MMLIIKFLFAFLLSVRGLRYRSLPSHRPISSHHHPTRLLAVYQTDDPNPEDAGYYPLDEDAFLGALREEKQLDNDRWQSILFRDSHSGSFSGTYEAFVPGVRNNGFGLMRRDYGRVEFLLKTEEMKPFGVKVQIFEKFASEAPVSIDDAGLQMLLTTKDSEFIPADLRLANGNQVIGNSFTIVQNDDDLYIAEIAIREGPIRIRVKYGYSSKGRNFITDYAVEMKSC